MNNLAEFVVNLALIFFGFIGIAWCIALCWEAYKEVRRFWRTRR